MGDYFKGWRRKFGVATLLLACVFMGGWVRSQQVVDSFKIQSKVDTSEPTARATLVRLISIPNYMVFKRAIKADETTSATDLTRYLGRIGVWTTSRFTSEYSDATGFFAWPWTHCGIALGNFEYPKRHPSVVDTEFIFAIPYWSITIPLTLLSAFLLLTKPRKTTSDKLNKPVPEKVE